MQTSAAAPAYIVGARRTALGRVGGLHRSRRIEDLAAPVVTAALADCKVEPEAIDQIVIGSAAQGGNPARLIALAAGLPDTVAALTIDCQCGSGLEAILIAVRSIALGEASAVVAGGADSVSTAPWRIAKPRSLYQMPHFVGLDPAPAEPREVPHFLEAGEGLSRQMQITREQQDDWTARSHARAEAARTARRFVGEIVPLRGNVEEARDESAMGYTADDLARLPPYVPEGTLTAGNTSLQADGAAIVVAVSRERWQDLGCPPALRLVASASLGMKPGEETAAPIVAMKKLSSQLNGFDRSALSLVEMSESSAAQAIAFGTSLGFGDDDINPDGGATVRGHPFGAAGAVLVARLFTRMARLRPRERQRYGVAALGAIGGLGMAALFEAVEREGDTI